MTPSALRGVLLGGKREGGDGRKGRKGGEVAGRERKEESVRKKWAGERRGRWWEEKGENVHELTCHLQLHRSLLQTYEHWV